MSTQLSAALASPDLEPPQALKAYEGRLEQLERGHRLDFLRRPDAGFAWPAYRWAGGQDLDEILTRNDQTAGDFVRQMKQLIDFAGQIADAAAGTPVRDTARQLVKLLRRGIVATEA